MRSQMVSNDSSRYTGIERCRMRSQLASSITLPPPSAATPPLRLNKHVVTKHAWLGQMHEHLGPLRARGIDLHASIAQDPPDERLPRRAVLDPVDGDDLLRPREHTALELDTLVGQRVNDRPPADPHHDEPQQCDSDDRQRQRKANAVRAGGA